MITSWDTIGALSFLLRRTMDEKWLKSKHSCGRWFFWIDFTWMHVPSSILPLSTFWKLIFGVKHGYHTHTHMCREFFTSSFYQFWSLCEQCFLWIFFGVPSHWTMFRHGKWLFSTDIRYHKIHKNDPGRVYLLEWFQCLQLFLQSWLLDVCPVSCRQPLRQCPKIVKHHFC